MLEALEGLAAAGAAEAELEELLFGAPGGGASGGPGRGPGEGLGGGPGGGPGKGPIVTFFVHALRC